MSDLPVEMTAFRIMAETGLSARELAEMDLSEWSRLAYGQTPAQAALAALQAQQQPPTGQSPRTVPAEQPDVPGPQGIDSDSPAYFHAWRAQRQRGGEGLGIFDAPAGQEYADAARAHAGRTGLSAGNVVEAPRLDLSSRFERQDDRRDTRTAAQRFGNPSNAWQGN